MWIPQQKQALALQCDADELFYGGAKGGGKSDFLLGDYTAGVHFGAAWRGVLFRRSYPELEEVITRSKEIYPDIGGDWSEGRNMWTFSGGATLKMRFLETDNDLMKYQGHAYTWIGFDELGNWPTPRCYTEMMTCLRNAKDARIKCYIRATGNPGGPGHRWVKNRFIKNKEPYTIYTDEDTMVQLPNGDWIAQTSCFIPARLEDNKALTEKDPGYEVRLKNAGHLYKAYRYGDWDAVEGSIFEELDKETHGFEFGNFFKGGIPKHWPRAIAGDWGYSTPFSFGYYCFDQDGRRWRYDEWYGQSTEKGAKPNTGLKLEAPDVAKKLWAKASREGIRDLILDPSCWQHRGTGKSVARSFQQVGFNIIRGNNDRIQGLNEVHSVLKQSEEGLPMLMVERDACPYFWETMQALLPDKNNLEDVDTKMEDHAYDEVRYMIMHRKNYKAREQAEFLVPRKQKKVYDPLNWGKK